MSETPGSWQPDPYGRFAQRYWDGSQWTENVTDASGTQSNDPPVPSATAGTATVSPPVPGLIVAGMGAVLVLLSLFVLSWYEFSGDFAESIRDNARSFEREVGLSASSVLDGLSFPELRDFANAEGADVPLIVEQYLGWGWIAAIGAVALAFIALFKEAARLPAIIALFAIAVWHAYTAYDSGSDVADTQVGAWAGAAGLVLAAVALLLPNSRGASRAL